MSRQTTFAGPLWVALAAFLWAFDAPFRSKFTSSYNAIEIVTVSHIICVCVVVLWFLIKGWPKELSTARLGKLAYVGVFGSAIAMILFTTSFATANNFTIPILVQKLQPIFAILVARLWLKEPLTGPFLILAVLALAGAYLLSFGFSWTWQGDSFHSNGPAVLMALGAAMIWGSTTVVGRDLMTHMDNRSVTGLRYLFATAFLVLLLPWTSTQDTGQLIASVQSDLLLFAGMALGPGLFALLLYYYGLRYSEARIATLAELTFPIGTVVINWVWLDQALGLPQLLGASLLIGSVTALSLTRHKIQ